MNESLNFLDAILNGNEEAMQYAVFLYEQAEKYKWHDLVKNPEDLPKNTGVYLVKRPTDRWTYCEYTVFVYNKKLWREQSVIAWREIEPFEVEE